MSTFYDDHGSAALERKDAEIERLKADLAEAQRAATNVRNTQRLWDLVRYQRQELFVAGLIDEDELAALAADHAAVERLETYDALRQRVEKEAISRPRIICLCGSTRFIEQFAILTWTLEREGYIVLGCTLLPSWYCRVPDHFGEATGTKAQCDELHKRKIDLADEILVLNIGGYIGESTRGEIDYATAQGKPVKYMEPLPEAAPTG